MEGPCRFEILSKGGLQITLPETILLFREPDPMPSAEIGALHKRVTYSSAANGREKMDSLARPVCFETTWQCHLPPPTTTLQGGLYGSLRERSLTKKHLQWWSEIMSRPSCHVWTMSTQAARLIHSPLVWTEKECFLGSDEYDVLLF